MGTSQSQEDTFSVDQQETKKKKDFFRYYS